MRPLVLYHANCADGFCAAWLFKAVFSDPEFVPVQYGEPPPDVAGRDVFVVDFSYKRRVLEEMVAACTTMALLDHHKTAEADLAPLDGWPTCCDFRFDMAKSGGRLAWEYLWDTQYADGHASLMGMASGEVVSRQVPPWLVAYTEDRDLWRWALPDSREVNAALRSHPFDFDVWDSLSARKPQDLVAEGRAILRRESQIVADHVKHAREAEMCGYKVLCVNATTLSSEIAGELAQGRPFGACYFDRADGKRQYSLRSRDGGVDVSDVARAHGGGGHRNAAGFELKLYHVEPPALV